VTSETGSSKRTERDHRNLSDRDFEFEDYDAYLDDQLETFFDRDRISDVDHSWDFVHDAQTLFEDGLFGRLFKLVNKQPSRAKWTHMKNADCIRCGEAEVGILGVMMATETPSGELVVIGQHSELCWECAERVEQDLEEHGQPQPTLGRGKWWPDSGTNEGETA